MPVNDYEWNDDIEGELILRCDVARYENPSASEVIGIAIGNDIKKRFRFHICYIDVPEIDKDFTKHVNKIKNELGYFKNTKFTNLN
jgi:hypothetical protein